MKFWIQQWEESERGWGTRPDGFTAHLEKKDIDAFLQKMRKDEKEIYGNEVPSCYSRPAGEPFEHELPEILGKEVKGNGVWLDYDWRPSAEADEARVGGWKAKR